MKRDRNVADNAPEVDGQPALDELILEGARKMLRAALDAEVVAFIEAHADEKDQGGRRHVVRNGRLPSREVMTGAGPIEIAQPRVPPVSGKLPRSDREWERRGILAGWGYVFTDAASVTVMVDRLVHRSELIAIEGDSYRMHEAEERKKRRRSRSRKPQSAGSEEA